MRFRLLGPVEAFREGDAIALGTRQQRTVLAILLLSVNRVVTVHRLQQFLWAGTAPRTGRNTLQVYVCRLRNSLTGAHSPVRILSKGDGYLLETDPHAIDVHRFRSMLVRARELENSDQAAGLLREALALWTGPALANVTDICAERFGRQLEDARLAALCDRREIMIRMGRPVEAMDELTDAVADHPLDERLIGLYMRALYRTGRQAEALDAYRRISGRLRGELGIDPGRPLRAIFEQILRHQEELEPWPDHAPATSPWSGGGTLAPPRPVPTRQRR